MKSQLLAIQLVLVCKIKYQNQLCYLQTLQYCKVSYAINLIVTIVIQKQICLKLFCQHYRQILYVIYIYLSQNNDLDNYFLLLFLLNLVNQQVFLLCFNILFFIRKQKYLIKQTPIIGIKKLSKLTNKEMDKDSDQKPRLLKTAEKHKQEQNQVELLIQKLKDKFKYKQFRIESLRTFNQYQQDKKLKLKMEQMEETYPLIIINSFAFTYYINRKQTNIRRLGFSVGVMCTCYFLMVFFGEEQMFYRNLLLHDSPQQSYLRQKFINVFPDSYYTKSLIEIENQKKKLIQTEKPQPIQLN
ncbi:transmembrane protein, putative (macronuclear) [Tetrahymena thermophila SB210]|uniref:Transmembrane protein, putative n=1 Tax=Tetrahymena thermophila (strain SB210) TaxID=312017 RepID=W7WYA1_TETTS|nr:transmembrane protein, putative [Tetrahymena thermophila SB210]EWS71830.1 transmembrane protein, putative [Tetrahymena thermophila SB210]|eukprot:XP_012655623.1 transmembrane protein, putative [Tetrahymena thermophila SB210]